MIRKIDFENQKFKNGQVSAIKSNKSIPYNRDHIFWEKNQLSLSCATICSTSVVIIFVIALRKEFPQLNPDLRKQCQTAATALTKLHLLDPFEYEEDGNMGCQISK